MVGKWFILIVSCKLRWSKKRFSAISLDTSMWKSKEHHSFLEWFIFGKMKLFLVRVSNQQFQGRWISGMGVSENSGTPKMDG